MQVNIHGFIIAKNLDHNSEPTFTWSAYDQTEYDRDCVLVSVHTITFDVPDNFDYRRHKIDELKRRRENETNRIDTAISQLQSALKENHA